MIKLALRAVSGLVLSVPFVAFSATPANAGLGSCQQYRWDAASVSGYCEGSRPTSFYEFIECTTVTGARYTATGPTRWAGEGLWSYVSCNSGDSIVAHFPVAINP